MAEATGSRAAGAAVAALLIAAALASAAAVAAASAPELPRERVDTDEPARTGRVHVARDGAGLRAALDAAQLGDEIRLLPGVVYAGPFVLPAKTGGSGWIVLRSNASSRLLPPPGRRIDPSYARHLPKLEASEGAVLRTAPGAHHYRLIGLEVRPGPLPGWRAWRELLAGRQPRPVAFLLNLVELGSGETALDELPHHIVVDRCYLHGDPQVGARRGIALNSRHSAVIDSYFADFKEQGADSQAIAGWSGPGPFLIRNNHLEGAGENLMFGGADPSIAGLVPADIEVRQNRFTKPLAWKLDDPAYAGTPWTVKNLFELKNARRVLVEGNLFENNWVHAQAGFGILFTVRNQQGTAPWSTIEDVSFVDNVMRRSANGIHVLGFDDLQQSGPTRRIAIRNNLFEGIGLPWGRGILLQIVDGAADVALVHNTALQTDAIVVSGDGDPHPGFAFDDNIAPHNEYGIIGSGSGIGAPSLARYFPGASIRGNALVGAPASVYPAANAFPATLDDVGFADRADGDFRLLPNGPLAGTATDGGAPGADLARLCAALAVRDAASVRSCAAFGRTERDKR